MSADLSRYYKSFPPRAHQVRAFEAAKDREAFAFFMEPRLGKSLVTLMNAAYLYEGRRIDALGVSAPAGVHRNWVLEEIPKHLPEWTNHRCYAARSGFARTKAAEKEREDLLAHPGLIVFAVNTEAFIVEDLREWLGKFFRRNSARWRAMYDEASLPLGAGDKDGSDAAFLRKIGLHTLDVGFFPLRCHRSVSFRVNSRLRAASLAESAVDRGDRCKR